MELVLFLIAIVVGGTLFSGSYGPLVTWAGLAVMVIMLSLIFMVAQ